MHTHTHARTRTRTHTVDITVYHGGYHGDLNETMFVGNVDEAGQQLVKTAYECMMKGIETGKRIGLYYLYNIVDRFTEV